MNGLTSLAVMSEETAARALDYFNGFHDGFIKRIVFESRDESMKTAIRVAPVYSMSKSLFAHYNYADGPKPFHAYSQIVRGEFRNVQDILADFREGFLGNTIASLSISPVSRRKGGQTATEKCLRLGLTRHYYLEEHRRYELRESQLFTFTDATFIEELVK